MTDLPSGTVTFLFTDIEGSTALLTGLGDRYREVLDDHDRLLRVAFGAHGGHEVDNAGDGFFVAFGSAQAAAAAAVDAQRALALHDWPDGGAVTVRMGLHTGEATISRERYVGIDVHRAARIGAAAHGGQIVVSNDTRDLVASSLPPGTSLRDLGFHVIKGFADDEHLHQLTVEGLRDGFPPLRTLGGPGSLPVLPTGFVGRIRELDEVDTLLDSPDVRLLTLTGPGGSGKTRLALEAVSRTSGRFSGGAFFVPLAPVRDPDLVASTIAEVVGLREVGERRAVELLTSHLHDRHALLVLDNFEQVHDAGAVVSQLLAAAPRLRVLVTSRSPLHLYGEHELPVRPMAVPGDDADVSGIGASEAVQLFVQRARAVQAGFALTPENARAVAAVVTRVDGLPLAIELAASRVRLLSPQELAARLGQRLRLLTGGASDLPDRQRTLRAAIDWSHDLLDASEQALFRRLGVFIGGFTIDAAAAVVDPADQLPFDLFDGVSALVDASLLWAETRDGGPTRFRMLETLREYARERLEAHGETEEYGGRHARHYLGWAEHSREDLDAGDTSMLEHFDRDHDNVLAALEWADTADEPDAAEIGLRLVTAMGWYWYTRGHTHVAISRLERALERGASAPARLRAKPLYWLGAVLDRRGDLERARGAMQASVDAWREVGDVGKLAVALNGLGAVAENQDDQAAARTAYEESVANFRAAEDDHGIASVLSGLGTLALSQGRLDQASDHLTEALRLFTAADDAWSIAVIESQLAWVELERGHVDEAAMLAHDATMRFRDWGEQTYLAACLELHAALAAPTRPRRAARLSGAAAALRDTIGASLPERERRDLERHLAPARERLGGAFDDASAAGAATPIAEVIDEVSSPTVRSEATDATEFEASG